ncbi:MAG: serine/threonine protein kinase [Myxococcales bacterium]|nr:serine/threonine protein kinase [Myxococcales bacterium]
MVDPDPSPHADTASIALAPTLGDAPAPTAGFLPPAPLPRPTPARPVELPGTGYVLIEALGRGGMGEVFRAWDRGRDRQVALKLVRADLARDDAAVARLRREALALQRVRHPAVVGVHAVGVSADARPYVALDLVRGRDLRTVLKDGRQVSARRVARLGVAVCDALAAVHAAGIVHRDLKPGNLMLGRRWSDVTLLDFGVARIETEARLTLEGQNLGTPGYMAPEVFDGGPIDARADQYGLAMILYEALTGDHPYRRATPFETLLAQTQAPPPPLTGRADLMSAPPALLEAVMRGLARDPADRYPDVRRFGAALRRAGRDRASRGPGAWMRRAAGLMTHLRRAPAAR